MTDPTANMDPNMDRRHRALQTIRAAVSMFIEMASVHEHIPHRYFPPNWQTLFTIVQYIRENRANEAVRRSALYQNTIRNPLLFLNQEQQLRYSRWLQIFLRIVRHHQNSVNGPHWLDAQLSRFHPAILLHHFAHDHGFANFRFLPGRTLPPVPQPAPGAQNANNCNNTNTQAGPYNPGLSLTQQAFPNSAGIRAEFIQPALPQGHRAIGQSIQHPLPQSIRTNAQFSQSLLPQGNRATGQFGQCPLLHGGRATAPVTEPFPPQSNGAIPQSNQHTLPQSNIGTAPFNQPVVPQMHPLSFPNSFGAQPHQQIGSSNAGTVSRVQHQTLSSNTGDIQQVSQQLDPQNVVTDPHVQQQTVPNNAAPSSKAGRQAKPVKAKARVQRKRKAKQVTSRTTQQPQATRPALSSVLPGVQAEARRIARAAYLHQQQRSLQLAPPEYLTSQVLAMGFGQPIQDPSSRHQDPVLHTLIRSQYLSQQLRLGNTGYQILFRPSRHTTNRHLYLPSLPVSPRSVAQNRRQHPALPHYSSTLAGYHRQLLSSLTSSPQTTPFQAPVALPAPAPAAVTFSAASTTSLGGQSSARPLAQPSLEHQGSNNYHTYSSCPAPPPETMGRDKKKPVSTSETFESKVPDVKEPPAVRISRDTRLPTPDFNATLQEQQLSTIETGFLTKLRNQHAREAREAGVTGSLRTQAFGGPSASDTTTTAATTAPPPSATVVATPPAATTAAVPAVAPLPPADQASNQPDNQEVREEEASPAKAQAGKRKRAVADEDDSDNEYFVLGGQRLKKLKSSTDSTAGSALLQPAPVRSFDRQQPGAAPRRVQFDLSSLLAGDQQPAATPSRAQRQRIDSTAQAQADADAMDAAYDRLVAEGRIRDTLPAASTDNGAAPQPRDAGFHYDASHRSTTSPSLTAALAASQPAPAPLPAAVPSRVATTVDTSVTAPQPAVTTTITAAEAASTSASPAPTAGSISTAPAGPLTRQQIRENFLVSWPAHLSLPPVVLFDQNSGNERIAAEEERNKLRKKAGLKKTKGSIAAGLLPWYNHDKKDSEVLGYRRAWLAAPESEKDKKRREKRERKEEKKKDGKGKKGGKK